MPGLEDSGEGRFSVHVEKMQKSRCVSALSHVHDHRSVRLLQVLLAEPRQLGDLHVALLL